MALAHVSAKSVIESLSFEDSVEAGYCNLFYAKARDAVLRDTDWNFARKIEALATPSGQNKPGYWAYVYAYPGDCIRALNIVGANRGGAPTPFEVAVSSGLDKKLIFTNQQSALLQYTARVENPNVFDPLFIDCLAWRLAMYLAAPLQVRADTAQGAFRSYQAQVAVAATANQEENQPVPQGDGEWILARE